MAGSAFQRLRSVTLALLLIQPIGTVVQAQVATARDTSQDGRTVVPRDTSGTHKTLFTHKDAFLAAGFVGLTFAMFPLDKRIAANLQDSLKQANKFFDKSASGLEQFTSPGAYVIGGGLYAIGRLTHHNDIADLGWHGMEALILSAATTDLLKGMLGRSRPYVSNNKDPNDFDIGQGFGSSERQSFPSGHTTTAFAAAAAVTSEVRRIKPEALWVVAPLMYGGASLVGLSRMYHNKHWASDVVLGAAIGTFSGLKVVRYSHSHPDNKLDRFILRTAIVPDGQGGAAVAFSLPTP